MHKQAAPAELELGECESPGHATQTPASVAPTVTEYVPEPQSEQTALPALVLYFPATHNAHAPDSPVLPAAQSNWHAANAVLPAGDTPTAELPDGELEFLTHATQAVAPTMSEYEFTGHATQVSTAIDPTVSEYVPATQSKHATLPLLVLYLPATHAEHTPPSGPVKPRIHMQPAMTELDVIEFEFAGQDTQATEAVVGEYKPTPQSEHASLPMLVLYLPGTHAEQFPCGPVYPCSHGLLPAKVEISFVLNFLLYSRKSSIRLCFHLIL